MSQKVMETYRINFETVKEMDVTKTTETKTQRKIVSKKCTDIIP